MKKFLLAALFAPLLFWACSNDFDVIAPWRDIPIVYGLLNIADSAHYIRVEKAFLDPDGDAFQIAQIPDSLYYQNAIVQLEKVNKSQVFTLQRVDGTLEGYPREPGVFATAPNWLYKIDSLTLDLKPGDSILIHIDRGNALPIVTAGTAIIEKGVQRIPTSTSPTFSFDYNLPSKVNWSSSMNARIFDVKLVVRYAEYPANQPDAFVHKSFEWKWGQGLRFNNFAPQYSVERIGAEFYQVVAGNIPETSGMKRVFEGIDLYIIQGGYALEKFINVAQANTGITGSQELPTYTNLSEGLGVFTTIGYLITKDIQLTQNSRDSLRDGIFTKHLNF